MLRNYYVRVRMRAHCCFFVFLLPLCHFVGLNLILPVGCVVTVMVTDGCSAVKDKVADGVSMLLMSHGKHAYVPKVLNYSFSLFEFIVHRV